MGVPRLILRRAMFHILIMGARQGDVG
ncbi:uncharacterized protein G2W53_041835 [Senna tora]|uniref:Uncharacterized protein n=1 Tax=Senna tora TaxID=362788 RepID=A0A834SSQ7_9FABA|nr:uncharacterized protein G2W53_041835 [Senna tora]